MDERNIELFVLILLETDEIIGRLNEFDVTEDIWNNSRAVRDMLLMPLVQIGELTTRFRGNENNKLFPDVPWKEIKGFRNVVVHGYGEINLDIAWNTVTEGTKELRQKLLTNNEVVSAYNKELEEISKGITSDIDPIDVLNLFSNSTDDDITEASCEISEN